MRHWFICETEMGTSTQKIYELSSETPEYRLILHILALLDDYHWLADITGRILAASSLAGGLTKVDGQLPALSGEQVQINLAELVSDVAVGGEDVKLFGLELEIDGKLQIADLQIANLPAKLDGKELFFVTVRVHRFAKEQADENLRNGKFIGMTGLAARIAHEINNPLDGSIRYINLALRRLNDDIESASPEKLAEYLGSAKDALGKINEILTDLSSFAKNGQSKSERVSVNELIEQAVQTFSAHIKAERINVVTMLSDEIAPAGGTKLYQVFCNLLKNAIDAIAEKRKVDPAANGVITITSQMKNGMVDVIFEDTGVGLPAEREYLFDPFYTTKPPEKGTGLGLAISREIVEQYNGDIRAEDGKSGGAKLIITLRPV